MGGEELGWRDAHFLLLNEMRVLFLLDETGMQKKATYKRVNLSLSKYHVGKRVQIKYRVVFQLQTVLSISIFSIYGPF